MTDQTINTIEVSDHLQDLASKVDIVAYAVEGVQAAYLLKDVAPIGAMARDVAEEIREAARKVHPSSDDNETADQPEADKEGSA